MIKENCFGYNEGGWCNALNCLQCAHGKCNFYKDKSKVDPKWIIPSKKK